MSIVAIVQVIVLAALAIAILLWAIYFPFPSPLVRRFLSPRRRWPEMQVRGWLKSGRFQSAFLSYFNRDPERTPPPGEGLLAPADGLVTGTDILGDVRYLVIALNFWDMHVQRCPISGTVLELHALGDEFIDGEGREFSFLREKSCPVQKRIVIATSSGQIAVRLITSFSARRIETWVQGGEEVERGQRIGRILLGSTVVLELPTSARLMVRKGDRVRAGETVVAEGMTGHG